MALWPVALGVPPHEVGWAGLDIAILDAEDFQRGSGQLDVDPRDQEMDAISMTDATEPMVNAEYGSEGAARISKCDCSSHELRVEAWSSRK